MLEEQKKHVRDDGTVCLMEPIAVKEIIRVVEEVRPAYIVELGTYQGGLTMYLADALPHGLIYSFDNKKQMNETMFDQLVNKKNNVVLIMTDVFHAGMLFLIKLLSSSRRKILICDNGNKRKEVLAYIGFLNPGDCLIVHDWGSEVFPQDVSGVLSVFNPDPINKQFDKTGESQLRIFYKKDFGEL